MKCLKRQTENREEAQFCLACGHLLGATGALQIIEIIRQLRGAAGPRQVKGAKIGFTHSSGAGPNSVITILKR